MYKKIFVLLILPFLCSCLFDSSFSISEKLKATTPSAPSTDPDPAPSPIPPPPAATLPPLPTMPSPSNAITFPVNPANYYDEREIIFRSLRNFEDDWSLNRAINLAKAHNFTTVSFTVKQDEDDPDEDIVLGNPNAFVPVKSGVVFFSSAIAPRPNRYQNYDVVTKVITKARAEGLKIKAWFPLFHDQVAATAHPEWAMMALVNGNVVPYTGSNPSWPEYFVNPLNRDVQLYQLSLLKEFVTLHNVDSIVLDWLRFDDFNMDMSNATRADFEAIYGVDPINIDFTTNNLNRKNWNTYRTTKVAIFVAEIRDELLKIRPNLEIGAYILPPEFIECGQDAAKIAPYLDFLSPMAYYSDWGQTSQWVYDTLIPSVISKAPQTKIIPVYEKAFSSSNNTGWKANIYSAINNAVSTQYSGIRSAAYFKYQWWDDDEVENSALSTKK